MAPTAPVGVSQDGAQWGHDLARYRGWARAGAQHGTLQPDHVLVHGGKADGAQSRAQTSQSPLGVLVARLSLLVRDERVVEAARATTFTVLSRSEQVGFKDGSLSKSRPSDGGAKIYPDEAATLKRPVLRSCAFQPA
jgi:hypothetical protein